MRFFPPANIAQLADFDEIVDVRTPAEFAEDHVPGAINCPVLSDEERVTMVRNILAEVNYGYTRYDFNGVAKRHDNDQTAGLGFRYLINRSLYTDLNYNFSTADSSDDTSDYSRNMVTLRLGAHL